MRLFYASAAIIGAIVGILASEYDRAHPCVEREWRKVSITTYLVDSSIMVPIDFESMQNVCVKRK